jgi:hypothetical protein
MIGARPGMMGSGSMTGPGWDSMVACLPEMVKILLGSGRGLPRRR